MSTPKVLTATLVISLDSESFTSTLPAELPKPDLSCFPKTPPPQTGQLTIASPNKPDRHLDVLRIFTDEYQLSEVSGNLVLKRIYEIQQTLGLGQSQTIEASHSFPHKITVYPCKFLVSSRGAGRGGNGAVEAGPLFPTERDEVGSHYFTPSKTVQAAVKRSHQRTFRKKCLFSPVKRRVNQYIRRAPSEIKPFFCEILQTSTERGRSLVLMPAYSHNFSQIDWGNILSPAKYLIHKTALSLLPLSFIHLLGDVHRDWKPDNIMDTDEYDLIKLIDLDQAGAEHKAPHRIEGTLRYLNPRSFGDAEEMLINQKTLMGIQRSCDDMFAFAHSGIEMILDLCTKLIPSSDAETHQLIKALSEPRYLTPENDNPAFSDVELTQIGRDYSKHHIYFASWGEPQRVAILPNSKTYLKNFSKIFTKLPLPSSEITLLKMYTGFCVRQKFKDDSSRLSAAAAHSRLIVILRQAEGADSESISYSLSKRQRTSSQADLHTSGTVKRRQQPRTLPFTQTV